MATHKCTKEGELATMAQQIKNIDDRTNRIETKLDKFIETADDKYASKKEFDDFKRESKEEEKNLKDRIWGLVLKVLPWAVAMFLAGLGIYRGGG